MEEGNKSIINLFSICSPEELTTADLLYNVEVRDFVISQMGAEAVSAVADMHDLDSGRNFKEVIVVAGNILSGTNSRTRGRIEGFLRIKQILTPPAINFQVSLASVVLKGGLSAIAARDVLGGAFIVATAGDSARGLPNETIQSFGPPVSNGVFPFPFGAPRPPSGGRICGDTRQYGSGCEGSPVLGRTYLRASWCQLKAMREAMGRSYTISCLSN